MIKTPQALDALIKSCDEAISGEWDKSDAGFEDMRELLEQVKTDNAELVNTLKDALGYVEHNYWPEHEGVKRIKAILAKAGDA